MRVRPSTILLEDSVAIESLLSTFQCNEKHFFDINSMINCSFVQNYQWHYALGIGNQSNHYFLWNFLSLVNTIFSIGISTIYCPYPIILRVLDTINVKELLIRKENSYDAFVSKICPNPICRFFPFIIRKQ